DLQVVVAFRMLPEVVWNMPRLGTMNLHGSLLPAYRGAAPIQWAIINGEYKTGLTTFLLQHKIDEGHILKQIEIPVLEEDNAGSLHDRMMYAGARLVIGSVDLLHTNHATLVPQDDTRASFAPKIHHDNTNIQWSTPVVKVHNLIRGMSPYPGAWTVLDGKEWKIFQAEIYSEKNAATPGKLRLENKKLIAQALDGEVEILEVQLTGRKKMKTADFINGYQIKNWTLT
ncbi:MAG: methionyl-tRNA formyltransferase, partial [Saprospiraceae bacterium]